MNADNIAVTQQEEEEWKLRNQITDNQNFKVDGKNGENLGEPKVEPKEGEIWFGSGISADEACKLIDGAWAYEWNGDELFASEDPFTPISRLYTQEEYDNKPVNPVDDSEWKNGDPVQLRVMSSDNFGYDWDNNYRYGAFDKKSGKHFVVTPNNGVIQASRDEFRKPESTEDKDARERLESAYDIYCSWCLDNEYPKFSFDQFTTTEKDKKAFLRIVDKTGYRK